jgi:hypothetical protein
MLAALVGSRELQNTSIHRPLGPANGRRSGAARCMPDMSYLLAAKAHLVATSRAGGELAERAERDKRDDP